jgi:hypothetical protein
LSPEASWKNVDSAGLRIARLAYVMHYSLGTQAHMMRTRRLTARTPMRALGKSLRRAPTPCDNHLQRESFSASSAPKCSTTTRNTMDCDPCNERMAANSTRVGRWHFHDFWPGSDPGSGLDPARLECFLEPGSASVACGCVVAGSNLYPTWIQMKLSRSLALVRPGSGLDPARLECFLGPGSGPVAFDCAIAGSDLDPTWIQMAFSRFLAQIRPGSGLDPARLKCFLGPGSAPVGECFLEHAHPPCVFAC